MYESFIETNINWFSKKPKKQKNSDEELHIGRKERFFLSGKEFRDKLCPEKWSLMNLTQITKFRLPLATRLR